MIFRTVHYWLCCTGFNTDQFLAELGGIDARVELAPRPTKRFGHYDYVFIDASDVDRPIDTLLEQLLDKLEPARAILAKWGDRVTSGVAVEVRTNNSRYSEAVSPEVLRRLAELNLEVSFCCEHASPESN